MEYLISGFKLIATPGLRRYAIVPLLINILIFIGIFFVARHYFTEFDAWFDSILPSYLQWLASLLWYLFVLIYIGLALYIFSSVANILSSPFNNLLAEKVEIYLTGQSPSSLSLMQTIADVPRVIGRQLRLTVSYLGWSLVLLIFCALPFVQIFAAAIWFVFSAWNIILQYVDYPADNHRLSLREMRQHLQNNRWAALGLGMSILVASLVPVLNLFVMPAGVAAATKFWVERMRAA